MRIDISVIFLSRVLSFDIRALIILPVVASPPLSSSAAASIISFGILIRFAVSSAWLSPGIPSSTLYVGSPDLSSNSIDAFIMAFSE